MACGFEDTKAFMEKKEGAIAAVFNTDEVTVRILNGAYFGYIWTV
jgi:hypothetical protein